MFELMLAEIEICLPNLSSTACLIKRNITGLNIKENFLRQREAMLVIRKY